VLGLRTFDGSRGAAGVVGLEVYRNWWNSWTRTCAVRDCWQAVWLATRNAVRPDPILRELTDSSELGVVQLARNSLNLDGHCHQAPIPRIITLGVSHMILRSHPRDHDAT